MSKRPVPRPTPELDRVISTFKEFGITNAAGQKFKNFLMRGVGKNPGSIPKGDHDRLWMEDAEFTIAPGASTSKDKPFWLRRHYCIRNGGLRNVIFRGISYTDTILEHGDYGNVFGNYTIDGALFELLGGQAIQLCSYNTNSKASGKNDRVAEVGKAFYDAHVHDKGLITIQNVTVSECGLPVGDGRASYAISVFPGEQDVLIRNISATCLNAPPHKASGGMRNSYGTIHVSGKTSYLYYDGGSPYQSPRAVTVQGSVYVNYKNPDRPLLEFKNLASPVQLQAGSEWVSGKLVFDNCRSDIDIKPQVGKARIEIDGKDVGPVTAGYQRKAI